MEWLTNPETWVALITLTALEIVLGIDNIIFISILVGRLPHKQRNKARIFGLGLAMITRIILLLAITWVMKLTSPLFKVLTQEISGRDIILILGGLFLLWKSTREIHDSLEGEVQIRQRLHQRPVPEGPDYKSVNIDVHTGISHVKSGFGRRDAPVKRRPRA